MVLAVVLGVGLWEVGGCLFGGFGFWSWGLGVEKVQRGPGGGSAEGFTRLRGMHGREARSKHQARVRWDADKNDLRAHTIELADQRLAASGAEALGGDLAKADPEELFVASLSSCHMLWFISLARAERPRVTAYEDEAEGTIGVTRFTRVVLRPQVSFEADPGTERVMDLHHRAHERCFFANSVSCPVAVKPRS